MVISFKKWLPTNAIGANYGFPLTNFVYFKLGSYGWCQRCSVIVCREMFLTKVHQQISARLTLRACQQSFITVCFCVYVTVCPLYQSLFANTTANIHYSNTKNSGRKHETQRKGNTILKEKNLKTFKTLKKHTRFINSTSKTIYNCIA